LITTVETQTVLRVFGATLLTNLKDGIFVSQSLNKNAKEMRSAQVKDAKVTEDIKPRQRVAKHAKHGTLNLPINIIEHQQKDQVMA
jgi:hypothetical protein